MWGCFGAPKEQRDKERRDKAAASAPAPSQAPARPVDAAAKLESVASAGGSGCDRRPAVEPNPAPATVSLHDTHGSLPDSWGTRSALLKELERVSTLSVFVYTHALPFQHTPSPATMSTNAAAEAGRTAELEAQQCSRL
jgi:hypothetical protein